MAVVSLSFRIAEGSPIRVGGIGGIAEPDGHAGGNGTTGWFVGLHGERDVGEAGAIGLHAEFHDFPPAFGPPDGDIDHRLLGLSAMGRLFGRRHRGFADSGLGLFYRRFSVSAPDAADVIDFWGVGAQFGLGLASASRRFGIEGSYLVLLESDGWSYIGRVGVFILTSIGTQ